MFSLEQYAGSLKVGVDAYVLRWHHVQSGFLAYGTLGPGGTPKIRVVTK